MENNKTPKIRFKGFTDTWEQRELGEDLISVQTGTNLLGETTNKGTPLLKMGNIQRGYFTLEKLEYLSNETMVESENIAHYGDFFFNTRNTLELVGKGATWTGISGKYAFNSNLARFKFDNIDTIFFNYLYNTETMISQISSRAMGTTSVAAIYPRSLNTVRYKIPTTKEQTKIGTFFKTLDNLITCHQRKCDKLVNVKKSMLQKMFPKNGEKIPEIRFKGFTDTWEQREFNDMLNTNISTNSLSRDMLTYETTNIKNIHYGDILVKYGEIVSAEFDEIPCIIDDNKNKYSGSFLQNGDVIFADAAEDETAGKATEIADISDKLVVSGLHTIVARPIEKVASQYLGYYLNSSSYHNQLLPLMQGTKVMSISKSILSKTNLTLSNNLAEQTKIGTFFKTLDNLITCHQRELEKLKNIKKSMLQKMFVTD